MILIKGNSQNVIFNNVAEALAEPDTQIRLFGKPEVQGERRMGVCLARGSSIEDARAKANKAAAAVRYTL